MTSGRTTLGWLLLVFGVLRGNGEGWSSPEIAGSLAGLLGLGGGFVKVPAMNLLMRVPMKAATSVFSGNSLPRSSTSQ